MEQSRQAQMNNYKAFGRRPGNRNLTVEKAKDKKGTLKRLIAYFAAEKAMIIGLLAAVIVVVICSVYAPKLQSNAIDIIASGRFKELTPILITMVVVYIIHSICTFLQTKISAVLSQNIVKKMREDLFRHIVNLPVRYLDSNSHGDIMSRMTNDIENISTTVSQSLSSMFSGVLTIIGTVIMMTVLCPQLALLSCVTVILTVIATKFLSKAMKKFFTKRQVLLGNLNGTVEEMVTGYKSVVAYNRQENVIKDFNNVSDELTRVGIIAEILGGSMGPVMNVINNISFVIIAAFGGYFAINHIISIGVISAFIVYAKQFGRPIDELAQIYGQIQTAIAGAERVFAVMDEPLEDKSGDKNMDKLEGVIKFKDVNFSYTKDKQVLYDFNLQVKAGQKVALVGSTGSGKTTVVNLLMRFYDVDSGEILIDDVNIKDIDCATLRKNTAIVLQDTVLFADTIKNNLKYSNEAATDEQMYAAAAMSNCDTMINKMPLKYDTELMAEGENISQGQRQLLSIARAFLAQPKILILDEATSNVDTRTEKRIQDAMLKLMENRTSLIIAHRLSTIQDADIIVVMDEGHIVEAGNHKELLNKMGRYYKLYMTQFAGQTI
ncbi:MAG: ABC transporter ATP-binding protein [Eubacterium sp.]|uniref:ABC transporter ATP-binding protein n=1 Tax=[Lactobacillus] rogosae TaxID=706562 RepID=UPI003FEE71B7|nr:ABC transporter ATP-binding protein [Eubacterium sp.]